MFNRKNNQPDPRTIGIQQQFSLQQSYAKAAIAQAARGDQKEAVDLRRKVNSLDIVWYGEDIRKMNRMLDLGDIDGAKAYLASLK